MRKYISIALASILIIGAFFIVKMMIESNKKSTKKVKQVVKTVFIDIVENKDIPIIIEANGTLVAKNRIDIFSEVQGVLQPTKKDFKAGGSYKKGEIILRINSEEYFANLQAQKSNLYNAIISIMPDVRLDYPDEYEKWKRYLANFDFNKATPKLPVINSEKEKYFISGRNIYTSYYNVKNMEIRLSKYIIRAPYKGVLTEALVNLGSLVRQGQKLGEYINPSVYEMEIAINANYIDLLQKGNSVSLHNLKKTKTWEGTVIRVNGKINQASQTVKAFIQVSGSGLKEGMYLEANLVAKKEINAYEISRKLLVNNKSIYIYKDSVLELLKINPVYFKDKTVIVRGLKNGTQVLSKNIPGAYVGMIVKPFNGNTNKK